MVKLRQGMAAAALLLAGCTLNPYVSRPTPQEFRIVQETRNGETWSALHSTMPNAREIRFARWYLGEVRKGLEERHGLQFNARSTTNAGIFGAAVGGAAAALFGGPRDLLIGLATGGTAGVTGSTLFLGQGVPAAYRAGLRALDCIDDQARYEQARFITWERVERRINRLERTARRSPVDAVVLNQVLRTAEPLRAAASIREVQEADVTRRIISSVNAVVGYVNEEVARYEPQSAAILRAGAELSAQVSATVPGATTVRPNLIASIDAMRRATTEAASRASPGEVQVEREPETAGDAGRTEARARGEEHVSPRAELNALAIALDALRGQVEAGDYIAPVCATPAAVPISAATGQVVTVGRGGTVNIALTGGRGALQPQPLTELPAGLSVAILNRTMTVTVAARVADGNYPVTIRDTPADPAARPLEYPMVITVRGTAPPATASAPNPATTAGLQRTAAASSSRPVSEDVQRRAIFTRAAGIPVLADALGESWRTEPDPDRRFQLLQNAYATLRRSDAELRDLNLPPTVSERALDCIERRQRCG